MSLAERALEGWDVGAIVGSIGAEVGVVVGCSDGEMVRLLLGPDVISTSGAAIGCKTGAI